MTGVPHESWLAKAFPQRFRSWLGKLICQLAKLAFPAGKIADTFGLAGNFYLAGILSGEFFYVMWLGKSYLV